MRALRPLARKTERLTGSELGQAARAEPAEPGLEPEAVAMAAVRA